MVHRESVNDKHVNEYFKQFVLRIHRGTRFFCHSASLMDSINGTNSKPCMTISILHVKSAETYFINVINISGIRSIQSKGEGRVSEWGNSFKTNSIWDVL